MSPARMGRSQSGLARGPHGRGGLAQGRMLCGPQPRPGSQVVMGSGSSKGAEITGHHLLIERKKQAPSISQVEDFRKGICIT